MPNAAGLGRKAQDIAAGSSRHHGGGDGALWRRHHRLRSIVLLAEAKAGENELRRGSFRLKGFFASFLRGTKTGRIFSFIT